MKTIEQLTNVEKAKIMFDLFREEMPEFIKYAQYIADQVVADEEILLATWSNPFLSYHQWAALAEQTVAVTKKYGKSLTKSANLFSEQLFGGYLAIFNNHCLEQYGLHNARSPRFIPAVSLFYLPVKPKDEKNGQFLVLEMHGGAENAIICTDTEGSNLVFDRRQAAEAEAKDCQNGFIVEV